MFEWINLALMISSLILFSVLYFFSLQPAKLSERMGEKAWTFCRNLRLAASFFELIAVVTPILWIWFPIPNIDWKIFNVWWLGPVLSLIIFIPGAVLMYIGVRDAGKETLTPSEETEMYGGIYKYIRHPQTTGEMPMFPALGLALNSWFIVIVLTVFVIIYVPVILIVEEKDLVRRFGESYKEYQKTTGAFLPKIRKRKE
ncbi:MAG: methyltransferase family protein [Candidatus Heimdallarchaeaceae archaeon]